MNVTWKSSFAVISCCFSHFSDEINKAYKKLAVLLHPDKSMAPGTEDAFKILVNARTSLVQLHKGD